MLVKILEFVLIARALVVGFSLLMVLVGTVIGLAWFLIKLAIPVFLFYIGYKLLFGREEPATY